MIPRFLVIPPTLVRWRVPHRVVVETRAFLVERGEKDCEAVVLWLGPVASEIEAVVTSAYVPHQIAYRSDEGLAVEIPVEEWTNLALRLPSGVFVLAKVHSHPGEAYLSEADVANPYLCHEGAVSIVVPDFARRPLAGFEGCSVNIFRGQRWIELPPDEVQGAFIV